MHTREATFVVTDVETTGIDASSGRIIEVGAVKVYGGEVTGRFEEFVNPGRSVPRRITRMTGITTAQVFDAPPASKVLPRFLEFLGEGVLVAHNLPFDQRFLDAELKRAGHPSLSNPTLCTLRLARRLLPGLKSKGLSSLIDFYGLHVEHRHRALGDAEATASLLLRFLSQLQFEYELERLEDVLAFQRQSYRQLRRTPSHLRRLRREVLPQVPDRPGVYFMKDGSGAPIYIGKARRLSLRVKSYFTGVEAHPPRRRLLVKAVRDVGWEETPSELDALLLESRLIKTHKPRFNRAARQYRMHPFIRLDTRAEGYPRLTWRGRPEDDGAEYFGPLASRREAEELLELLDRFFHLRECDDERFHRGRRCLYADIDRCTAPCEGDDGTYARELERVRAFLAGQDRSLLGRLEEEMYRAADRRDYEAAARCRDEHKRLKRFLDRQQTVGASITAYHAVLLRRVPERKVMQLFVIRFGRHVETLVLEPSAAPEALGTVRERLARHFDPEIGPPDYTRRVVDEMRLLGQWADKHRDEITQVCWTPEQGAVDGLLEAIPATSSS